jgi:uncharacterized protein (TIGR02271 family)
MARSLALVPGLRIGVRVRDLDGKDLGRVTRLDEWAFEFERGFLLFRRDYVAAYDEVREIRDGVVILARSDETLLRLAAGEVPASWRVPVPPGLPEVATPPEGRQLLAALAASRAARRPGGAHVVAPRAAVHPLARAPRAAPPASPHRAWEGGTEMADRTKVREGMEVRTRDDEKLGKIVRCGEADFEIEKGFFFPKEYLASFDDVHEVREDVVILAISADELKRLDEGRRGEHAEGARAPMAGFGSGQALEGEGAGRVGSPERSGELRGSGLGAGSSEELRVPVAKEELAAEKREREAGRVVVTKDVETEEQEVKVPVRKEKVRVERAPASGELRAGGEGAEDAFQEKSISVPVREEEVELRKRPVVKEEVRISKDATEEERTLSARAREEHADVKTEGDVERGGRSEPEK